MIWNRILGHFHQVEMFRRAIERGRLAHAYLLIGPPGIGKRFFAQTLAQCLFCETYSDEELNACGECSACKQMQAGTHPDYLTVQLPEGKKELPISLIAGDRDQRARSGLCYEISLSPMSAGRRIAVIDDADAMNEEAANALLKTLEEPPPGAILFLLTPETDPILPTIRSRCQPVRFSPLSKEQLLTLLQQEGLETQGIDDIIELAEGSLDVARSLLVPELQALWKTTQTFFLSRRSKGLEAAQRIGDALEAIGSDSATQRQNMKWVLQFAVETLRQQLSGTDDPAEIDRLGEMLDRCFEAELHLKQTMPIPLCLEALCTSVARTARS